MTVFTVYICVLCRRFRERFGNIQFLSSKIRNRVTIVDFEFSCSTRYMTFNLHKVLFDDFGKMQVKSTGKIS